MLTIMFGQCGSGKTEHLKSKIKKVSMSEYFESKAVLAHSFYFAVQGESLDTK